MAAQSYATQELALAAAITDGGVRDTTINSYDSPQHGPNPFTKTVTYVVVQVGDGRWVALKDGTGGSWSEV